MLGLDLALFKTFGQGTQELSKKLVEFLELATIGVDFNFKINDNVYSSYYFLINDIYS
jgi:hypothetical protein